MWIFNKDSLIPRWSTPSPNNFINVKKTDDQRSTFPTYKDWVPAKHKMAALKHGSRKFYDIPSEELSNVRSRYSREKENDIEELLNYIDKSCIGKDVMFSGPYGARKGELGARLQRELHVHVHVTSLLN